MRNHNPLSWPRTLFGRTVLVIVGLLVVSQIVTAYLTDHFLAEARATKIAEIEADRALLVLTAYRHLPVAARARYSRELQQERGVIVTDAPAPGRAPLPGDFMDLLVQRVKIHLGAGADALVARPDQSRGLWIKAPQQSLWVFIPNTPIKPGFPWEWIAAGSLAVTLGFAGALLIVWRLNRPLRNLSETANALGQGKLTARALVSGPQEIRHLGTQFNQMAGDLLRLEDERKLLLAGISHDVRVPLTRLRLGLEMLPPHTGTNAGNLIADVETIGGILEQFVALVYERGELPNDVGNVNELICEVAERYGDNRSAPTLRLGELPVARFHGLALQRLLLNLIENAYRHGGGNVEIASRAHDARVVINVRDRGAGMGETLAPSADIPLYAARGLGLRIAQRMAELHGGRVTWRNRDGGGLDVEVDLPLRMPD